MTKKRAILFYSILIIPGIFFLWIGLEESKGFLAPLVSSIILALLILPLSRKMERYISRTAASILSTIILLITCLAFLGVCSLQVENFISDWPDTVSTMKPKIEQFKSFVFEHTWLDKEDLRASEGIYGFLRPYSLREEAFNILSSVLDFTGAFIITLVYTYFLLNYRAHFEISLLKLFPDRKKSKINFIIANSASVAQQYIVGKLLTIAAIAVIYLIGLGLLRIENFIFVSILVSFFTLIPYLGNIISLLIILGVGYIGTGDTSVLIGILITFSIAELVESYVLQPYVVGDKVDIHPFLVIVGVILGSMVWGILGMILAIPVLGIICVIFRNIWVLRPFGFLLSKNDVFGKENS